MIVSQPLSRTNSVGSDATFTVVATSCTNLAYQWFKEDNALAGETNATLTRPNLVLTDAGDYRVNVANGAGMVMSHNAPLTVVPLPIILVPPQNQTVIPGSDVAFAVSANTDTPLTYQWTFNGADIPGETNTTLALLGVTSLRSGLYEVRVRNLVGSEASSSATLTVLTETSDTDGDGIPDLWELAHGLNRLDPSDADADGDGDGLKNRDEFVAGTDPHDRASRLALEIPNQAPGAGFSFTLNGMPNKSYSILYKNSLAEPPWQKLRDVPAQSTAHVVSISVPADAGTGRFFKVVTPQVP